MQSARYCRQVLVKLGFSQQVKKILKYKILLKSLQWAPSSVPTDGRMDGQT